MLLFLVIVHGADINKQNKLGDTPLHCLMASYKEGTDREKTLLTVLGKMKQIGLFLNQPNKQGNTPLHIACKNSCVPGAKWLTQHRVKVDNVNR